MNPLHSSALQVEAALLWTTERKRKRKRTGKRKKKKEKLKKKKKKKKKTEKEKKEEKKEKRVQGEHPETDPNIDILDKNCQEKS